MTTVLGPVKLQTVYHISTSHVLKKPEIYIISLYLTTDIIAKPTETTIVNIVKRSHPVKYNGRTNTASYCSQIDRMNYIITCLVSLLNNSSQGVVLITSRRVSSTWTNKLSVRTAFCLIMFQRDMKSFLNILVQVLLRHTRRIIVLSLLKFMII